MGKESGRRRRRSSCTHGNRYKGRRLTAECDSSSRLEGSSKQKMDPISLQYLEVIPMTLHWFKVHFNVPVPALDARCLLASD